MANLPEKNVVLVDKITNVPTDSNLFINANGEFKQASVNDVVNSSTVVSTAVETAINTAVQDSIDSNFKQTSGSPILLTDSADGTLIDFKGKGRSTQKQYSGKNFLKCSLTTAITQNGITFTPVYDGKNLLYINVNGTATDNAYTTIASNVTIPSGTYILNGCPSGGGESTYRMYTNSLNYFDYGNGATFTLNAEYTFANLVIYVFKGQALNNLKFYPMIRQASVTDSTYEPYTNGVAPNPNYPQAIKSVADGGYFDGELLQGAYNGTTGLPVENTYYIRNKNSMPCKSGDTIKLVYGDTQDKLRLFFYKADGTYISKNEVSNTDTIEVTAPTDADNFNFDIIQEISGLTPTNAKHITVTINDKYALKVKNVGKNLLNIRASDKSTTEFTYTSYENECIKATATKTTSGSFICSFSVYLEKDKSYIFSQSSTNIPLIYIYSDKLWGNLITSKNIITTANYEHTAESGTYIIGYYRDSTISGTEYSVVKPMLRLAEITDDTYEPYTETVKYIPLNEPLRSSLDGTVTDEVSFTEVNRRFGKFVLNGTENWYFTANANAYISLGGLLKPNGIVISDYYVVNRTKAENTILVNSTNVIIYDKRFATVDEWKAWLAENNVTLIYELAEPVTEEIEPVDIVTYDNVTYITATDNADMEIEYPTTKVAGIASIGYSKGIKAEYETEQLKKQLLEIQATIVNTL